MLRGGQKSPTDLTAAHSRHGWMKHCIVTLTRLGITIVVGWVLVARVNLADTWKQAVILAPSLAVAVVLVMGSQVFIAAWRLKLVVRMLNHHSSFRACLRASFAGGFVGQTPLSMVGGDMVRVWCIADKHVPLRIAASAVAIDRALGMTALLILIGFTLMPLWILVPDPEMRRGLAAMIVLALGGLAGVLSFRFLPGWSRRSRFMHWLWETTTALGRILGNGRQSFSLLGLGIMVQMISILSLYAIARGLNADLSLFDCLVLTPLPLFLSLLPISLGGWGIREAALVTAFNLAGIPTHTTLAISVVFGLAATVAVLPGVVVLLERNTLLKTNPSPANSI